MKRIVLAAPILMISSAVFGQSKIDSKVGVVNSTSVGEACIAIPNANLKKHQRIFVVLPHKPQSVVSASVKEKVKSTCSSDIDVFENASFYLIQMPEQEYPFVGFGIVGTKSIALVRGVARVDLNGDRKKEYFRTCTSNEGIHLTVWTGKPLIGKQIWHIYYYLRYDTVPTCRKRDYAGKDY